MSAEPRLGRPRARLRFLTWGVLEPGDGIEHAIRAIALLGDRRHDVHYLIAGSVHQRTPTADGDDYRELLTRAAWAAGVATSVRVDAARWRPESLAELVGSASAVILPDDPPADAVSPALVATLVAGRPVVATASPRTVELLAGGAGIVVPYGDPVALAGAIESVLDDPSRIETMAAQAREVGRTLAWSAAEARHLDVRDLVAAAVARS